jgi:RNA polymerase primary sigma factor
MNIAELNQTGTLKSISIEEVDFPYSDPISEPIDLEEPDLNRVEVEFSSGDQLTSNRSSGYSKSSSDDTVGAFFKEMARYPLLKPEEEVELAKRKNSSKDSKRSWGINRLKQRLLNPWI